VVVAAAAAADTDWLSSTKKLYWHHYVTTNCQLHHFLFSFRLNCIACCIYVSTCLWLFLDCRSVQTST